MTIVLSEKTEPPERSNLLMYIQSVEKTDLAKLVESCGENVCMRGRLGQYRCSCVGGKAEHAKMVDGMVGGNLVCLTEIGLC